MKRTHRCGELRAEHVGARVLLQGWVWRRRDLGGLIFIDLRDRAGTVQCVFDPERAERAHAVARDWRAEYVVQVEGRVVERAPDNVNPRQPNGDIEVVVDEATVLAEADTPPFQLQEHARATEELRLRYRYLDLRRRPLQEALALRHRLALAARNYLSEQGFLEIETPMLTRSTPEGARDYLVPSRVHPGSFYALPQSPQLFKQLLMVAGFDRYFQIVRCFRDEDLRADRQPEFTQIDLEMSFVEAADVRALTEGLIVHLLAAAGLPAEPAFPRLSFREALDRYGSDRPDLRCELELCDLTPLFVGCSLRAFASLAGSDGSAIKGLRVPGGAAWGRGRLDRLVEQARAAGARGLVWLKHAAGGYSSPVAKFLGEPLIERVAEAAGLRAGDLLLLVGDDWEVAATALGALRRSLAEAEGWLQEGMRFLWVTEFPLFERDDEQGRLVARHHPFTSPLAEDVALLESDPLSVRAHSYDLVLNGVELGGGSIRIHRRDLQQRVFAALGIDAAEAEQKFGFLLRALSYGAPPHGGIALGFDRIVMMMAGRSSLRDVIAFPKTTNATDLLTEAPAPVAAEQLEQLHIRLDAEAALGPAAEESDSE